MSKIFENWNKFLNESDDIRWSSGVWGIRLLQGHTKSKKWYQIVHLPSNIPIRTSYYKAKKKIVGYGAPAKSTTVLNFCNIDNKIIDKIFDNSVTKIGKYTPGKSLIPIEDSKSFDNYNSDYCVLFAWNHQKEIIGKEKNYSQKKINGLFQCQT